MHICIISSQILGFGKIGGFGSMTKKLAVALKEKGHQVSVVVPKRKKQKPIEQIDGLTIYGLKLKDILGASSLFKKIDADMYHSQNPNLFTYIAQRAQPTKKHVITCRDPRDIRDWIVETKFATWPRRFKTPMVYLFEDGPLIKKAIQNADIVGTPAHFLKQKVARLYNRTDAILLPNLENFPESIPVKSDLPTVCYVGRLDKRKRPELVIDLAKQFTYVKFLIVGKAEDASRQSELEHLAAPHPNIKMLGYIDKHFNNELNEIYAQSWIIINTAAREGLPMTFIEAAGHGCAILSHVNPDSFATEFGFHASHDNFAEGLEKLLFDQNWMRLGEKGFAYVKEVYSEDKALEAHLDVYSKLLNG